MYSLIVILSAISTRARGPRVQSLHEKPRRPARAPAHAGMCVCACVCVFVNARVRVYVCACVSVCRVSVCLRATSHNL